MTKKTYKVTGTVPFAGHGPGETFSADLEEGAERRALQRGSIKVVQKQAKGDDKNDDKETTA